MRIWLISAMWLLGAVVGRAAVLSPGECWALRKHGRDATACFERLTRSGDAAVRAEGFWGLEDWEGAKQQFLLVTEGANAGAAAKVRYGVMLHERFNNSAAADLFHEALANDPNNAEAYLGLATLSADGFDGKATEYLAKAVALDPKLVGAHELMAKVALENDDKEAAVAEADKAMALENDALDAMAIRATVELIADRSPDVWFGKMAAVNAAYGEGYALVGRELALHYRYEDAVGYYRKAVGVSPRLWSAHSALGIELMRQGKADEAYRELELSYKSGYTDRATSNSLKLLETLQKFETYRDDATVLVVDKKEAELLREYMQPEMHTILATYEKKYGMKLTGPVQVEVYPEHEDFAVRTLGMPGLGALGVTFGQVVAMDSPSARKPGEFNWGATMWHEMSHVFVLTATRHRVPRWFTEGLAVHEEGERSAEWANRVTPEVLLAIRDKKLLPVVGLDRGFVYPEYPSQVIVSYFQGGSICDFIKSRWGEGMLLTMVHSYAALKTTAEVVRGDLGLSPEEFDKAYLAWVEARYGKEAAGFDAWRGKLKALAVAGQAKQDEVVMTLGPEVVAMYPEYTGEGNAYEALADASKAKGDAKGEAAVLTAYEHEGGDSPGVLKRLATLEEAAGDMAGAAATLGRVNYIYPVKDEELHRRLGGLLYGEKQYAGAVREYAAAVASDPVDRAGAEFSLAQAYFAAGQKDKAEESVLAALETAPGYRPAQKLLLELNQSKTN